MADDPALIARAVSGEPRAREELATRHRPTVLRIARHILGDAVLAEDVTQDVFVRLQVSLPGFRGDADLDTWLYRITLNLCRDRLRQRRRARTGSLDELSAAEPRLDVDPERALDAGRAREVVRAAIDRLPDDQREAVTLRFISGLPYAEIARLTATPQGTIASRVFRALERLGHDLEPRHLEWIK